MTESFRRELVRVRERTADLAAANEASGAHARRQEAAAGGARESPGRNEHAGAGIGPAVCKKIVEPPSEGTGG